ncbi:FUSC family protein [Hymenobacter sp. ISL-91]|uniref:FUSC family membrane protein n=1 Tax=Hymenobacter sp. ISL-91 TaxID=2819151 RepID=UPI001BEB46F9|nr:FUSC family membrane protein [Hymenobacter sp. ISL-91]MBT2556240.1 FUSC family protein [Hymenobacter sp. ISL-91]
MSAHYVRQLRYFFSSQEFSDGLRTTLAILVPGLVLGLLGRLETGVAMSVGALCVSLTDTPGPPLHKRNGGLAAVALTGLMALLTGLVQPYPWLLGALVVAASFWLTMLLVYGNRAGAVGTAGLLVMILMLDKPLPPSQVLSNAGLVVAGGVWYLALALALSRLRPYREAQQALGEAVLAVAGFLRLKAGFYHSGTNLEQAYRHLVAQQVRVSEKQDGVRELLFKTRQLVSESSDTGRRLVLTFVDLVDLYEQVTITSYDYAELHRRFEASGLLDAFASEIDALAAELERVGFAIQGNYTYRPARPDLLAGLNQLKARLDAFEATPAQTGSVLPLRKILVNLRNLTTRLQSMQGYFAEAAAPLLTLQANGATGLELDRFVAHQQFTPRQLTGQLTMRSGIFRHALRMLVASLIGFIITEMLAGYHGYWVLMTITYMLKPAFSLTKQRNAQRILGTLLGGILGALMLWLISDRLVLLALMVGFMIVSFSFARLNYLITVVFMTPFVLILFSFMGEGYVRVVQERIFDTVLGCGIAFAVGYLLFPRWESEQLQGFLRPVLRANLEYLRTLQQALQGSPVALLDYKLARKEVYVTSANLGAAFQRMLSEPRTKQRHPAEVHEFVVLNHILAANVAAITSALLAGEIRPTLSAADLKALRQAQQQLRRGLLRLGEANLPEEPQALTPPPAPTPDTEDAQLGEQLEFIQKLSGDINRVTETVAGGLNAKK